MLLDLMSRGGREISGGRAGALYGGDAQLFAAFELGGENLVAQRRARRRCDPVDVALCRGRHRRPTLDQVANVAVFLASGWASTMTATEVNITAGAVVD